MIYQGKPELPDRYEKVEQQLDRLTTLILYRGPMTAYQACIDLQPKSFSRRRETQRFLTPHNPPPSTVQTHFDILVDQKELMVYERAKTGRRQKHYGFTPYGFLMALGDPHIKAKEDFKKIAKIWLSQKKFLFFLPKEEVLSKLDAPDVENSLASICLVTAAAFPVAQDVAGYLEEMGYGKFGPAQVIQFASDIASSAYPQQFLEWSKVLAREFSVFRDNMRKYVEAREQWLATLRKELITEAA